MRTPWSYGSYGSSPCPRCAAKDEEQMVPCQIQGERDDRNNWDGGTPGWEEFTTGACDVCGDDWTTEEEEQLRDNYRPYEPEVDE